MTETKGKTKFIFVNLIRLLLVLALFGAYYKGRWLVMFIAILALVITFIPFIFKRIWGVRLPAEFEVIVVLFIYGSLFLGEVRGMFSDLWWWGVLLNLVSAIALGFVGLAVLYSLHKEEKINASPFVIAFFAFCFAVAIGSIWEVFEFYLDTNFGFTLQNNSLIDTMIDISVNVAGALIVAIVGYGYIKDEKIVLISKTITKLIEKYPRFFKYHVTSKDSSKEVLREVRQGEAERREFKSSLRVNLHTGNIDKKIEHATLKTIVAFLNSKGGTLFIGISDEGRVLGLEKDNFQNNDKLILHFTNMIKEKIGNNFLPYIRFSLKTVNEKSILKVQCRQSNKQVFLKAGDFEEFYVRNGASSVKLTGSELVDYVRNKF